MEAAVDLRFAKRSTDVFKGHGGLLQLEAMRASHLLEPNVGCERHAQRRHQWMRTAGCVGHWHLPLMPFCPYKDELRMQESAGAS